MQRCQDLRSKTCPSIRLCEGYPARLFVGNKLTQPSLALSASRSLRFSQFVAVSVVKEWKRANGSPLPAWHEMEKPRKYVRWLWGASEWISESDSAACQKKTLNKKKMTCHTISMSYHFMSYYITEYHLINTYQFLWGCMVYADDIMSYCKIYCTCTCSIVNNHRESNQIRSHKTPSWTIFCKVSWFVKTLFWDQFPTFANWTTTPLQRDLLHSLHTL